jgi:UDP-N-acetylmuramate: L-alanyl-gamma-D-glutamyl-meso-diaminopimelate ligase
MRIHFIAIGGSAMHNLAIALHHKGYTISGSDDEIFEPSRSRLKALGLLPDTMGWFPEKINDKPDAVILGMHAKEDNPELLKAKELGIKIYSYPDFLYQQSKDKKRIVIGGSHGKTTITSMILHVLHYWEKDCDYMVGAQLEGFEVMVRLSEEAPCIVLEGDEYLTSPLDRRPKFHLYKPDIALISGIAWDHMNVFPTFDNYIDQFRIFANLISHNGTLIYCENDPEVAKIGRNSRPDIQAIPYSIPSHHIVNGITYLGIDEESIPLKVFGEHNLMNMMGAKHICNELGISDRDFYQAIQSFGGASKRLQLLAKSGHTNIYKDFAHSPSKLKATTEAVKKQYPDRQLAGVMELHTYSSLNPAFLNQYEGAMDAVDIPVVYFSEHALKIKKLPPLSAEDVRKAFNNPKIKVFTESGKLFNFLEEMDMKDKNLLLMSSGNFDGMDLDSFAKKLLRI